MKKKLFLALTLVAVFVCLFAISISAADMFDSEYTDTVTKFYAEDGTTEVKPDWADLTDANATAVIKKADGTAIRIPLYYIYQANGSTELRHEIRTGTGSAGFRYDFIVDKLGETVNHANLVALDIPEGIKTTSGLNNYTVLEEVVFPTTATSFPKSEKHPALKKVFAKQVENADGTIAGITAVSDYAFKNVTTLEYFGMQLNYLTYVGGNSFLSCAIKEINFEGPFTGMGGAAFSSCKSLTTVRFINTSSKIVSCGKQAFANCTALTSVVMDKFSIGECAFEKINATTGTLNFVATNVERVETSAFASSTALRSVDIEGPLTSVAGNVFGNCTGLEIVRIYNTESKAATCGDNLLSCGDKATEKPAITSVTLHNIDLGYRALYNLKIDGANISVTGNYTTIGQQALAGCSGITSFNIPEGVTTIGNLAFYNSGITSLHIPASVKSLGYQVAELTPITSLTFAENSNLTFIDHRAFRDCDSLVGPVILPYGLIEMDYGVFDNCAKLKAVKMPDTLTTLSGEAALFNSCPSLEYVQFSKNLTGTIYKSMFENCYALKAISLPDGVTKIDYKALRKCTSLEAVYLPSGLIELGSVNTGASDWGVFYQSPKVYLVNEPFNVFDGDKLVENFVMPQKPEVYYMPSGMTALGNSAFQDCSNLNKYIVFPTGITSVGECSQGAFYKASSSTNPVTFVFLGDMTSIRIRQNDNASSNMSFIFANPNDTGITSMEFIIGSANNAYMTNTYAYFCASNTVYDLSTFKATNATVHTVTEEDYTKTVNTAETQPHFRSPRNDQKTPATCVTPELSLTFCFCGTPMGTQETAPALGHAKDLEADEMWNYGGNYYANAVYVYHCTRCLENYDSEDEVADSALFVNLGYSSIIDGEGESAIGSLVTKTLVNVKVVEKYNNTLNGETIKYGIIVGGAG
ncbi:MAG: leucine-rich repeat domain-containing protein, partial [Clostridia bacterium]|nr:leucine-rich repeat domain-containing protein [Clostridia bacterium]